MSIPRTPDHKPIYSVWPTEGSRKTIITSNWADKTTWYQTASHISDDVAVATTSGSVYQLSHDFIIDHTHGKGTGEDNYVNNMGMKCEVSVSGTVSGTTNTYVEVDPHTGVGDYTLDYDTGEITFSPSVSLDEQIMATYCRATSSQYVFGPTEGKTLFVKDVEVQFSTDLVLTDTVTFQAFGYVQVFAPHLWAGNGGPYPTDTKIPLTTTKYKTMMDYVNEANGALPSISKLGGNGWRGMPSDVVIFPWNYQAMTALDSSKGMEVRINLEHDIPFEGSVATVTFYCLSVDEE